MKSFPDRLDSLVKSDDISPLCYMLGIFYSYQALLFFSCSSHMSLSKDAFRSNRVRFYICIFDQGILRLRFELVSSAGE